MKCYSNIILFFCLFLQAFSLSGADNYQVGDELFVWNRKGMIVYDGFTSDKDSIAMLPFGGKVKIVEITRERINKIGLQGRTKNAAPYILYGKWVKISFNNGVIGFIPDQFILRYQPYCKSVDSSPLSCFLETVDVDTLYQSEVYSDGESLNLKIARQYAYDIESISKEGGVWNEVVLYLPKCSIEEAFILFGYGASYAVEGVQLINNQKIT